MVEDKYTDLYKILDDRYVRKDDCGTRHEKLDSNIEGIKLGQETMKTKMDISNKIEWAILLACVTAAVTAFMNLILK